jgi:hypothetical protein
LTVKLLAASFQSGSAEIDQTCAARLRGRARELVPIRKTGRETFRHAEGARSLKIVGEMMTSGIDFVISIPEGLRWEPPFENEAVSNEDRLVIIQRFRDWLDRRRIKYVLENTKEESPPRILKGGEKQ